MGGIPEEENQSKGQTKEASSWLPKRLVHGMFLSRVGEIALSQNKLAFWIAMLLAVTTSPKYTTKSGVSASRTVDMTLTEFAS